MITLACDSNNDLFLDDNGDLATYTNVRNVCMQLSENYLQTFLGEVFTDTTLGLDWFGIMLTNTTTIQDKLDEIVRVLSSVPYVKDITEIRHRQDKSTREITFEIDVETEEGSFTLTDLRVGE